MATCAARIPTWRSPTSRWPSSSTRTRRPAATRMAIVDGPTGRSYSYAMLHHLVGRCAAGLAERGLQRHDVVGMFAPNIPEYADRVPRRRAAGAINTTINSLYTAHELAFQLQQRARALPDHDPAVPRPRAAGGRRGRDRGGVRVRRGRGRDAVRRRCSPPATPPPEPEIDPAHDLVVAALLERDDRAAQGRDAHAPQPGREHAASSPTAAATIGEDDRVIGVPAVLPHLRA